jgi:hypothetical protein
MILLMMSPILTVFQYENEWYSILEEKVLKMDLDHIKEEMNIADGRFEEMVREEYKETVKKQVMMMAEENGLNAEEVLVDIKQGDEEWQIQEISVKSGTILGDQKEQEKLSVEAVQIEGDKQKNINYLKEDYKYSKRLKKQICNYFAIGEDKVHIWE